MDIASKEILEDALNNYTGTILYVSHDRYFINRTATRIIELCGKEFFNYMGNYDYYLEKKITPVEEVMEKHELETESKLDWKTQKEEQARQRKRENDLKKCEDLIADLEEKISEIDTQMQQPEIACNSLELGKLTGKQAELQRQLDEQMELWETLAVD